MYVFYIRLYVCMHAYACVCISMACESAFAVITSIANMRIMRTFIIRPVMLHSCAHFVWHATCALIHTLNCENFLNSFASFSLLVRVHVYIFMYYVCVCLQAVFAILHNLRTRIV